MAHEFTEKLQEELLRISKPRVRDRQWTVESLGSCCHCATRRNVRTIITINKKAPIAGRGWGNASCGCNLPPDGALVVLCDRCADRYAEKPFTPKRACKGYPGKDGRVPFAKLTGVHEHTCIAGRAAPILSRVPTKEGFDA